jgi:hypothetical protein
MQYCICGFLVQLISHWPTWPWSVAHRALVSQLPNLSRASVLDMNSWREAVFHIHLNGVAFCSSSNTRGSMVALLEVGLKCVHGLHFHGVKTFQLLESLLQYLVVGFCQASPAGVQLLVWLVFLQFQCKFVGMHAIDPVGTWLGHACIPSQRRRPRPLWPSRVNGPNPAAHTSWIHSHSTILPILVFAIPSFVSFHVIRLLLLLMLLLLCVAGIGSINQSTFIVSSPRPSGMKAKLSIPTLKCIPFL